MQIPDPAVWASIPIVAGSMLWAAKQFVTSTIKGDKGDTGEMGSMSVRDYKELSEMLVTQLNGRYMFAVEARKRFESLECKMDAIQQHLERM